MKQTKQFLRPLLMAIVMLVGMLVPKGAWAQSPVTVGDQEFSTIQDAIDYIVYGAKFDATLTLHQDFTLEDDESIDINFESGSEYFNITIDLNGHTITGGCEGDTNGIIFYNMESGLPTVTIANSCQDKKGKLFNCCLHLSQNTQVIVNEGVSIYPRFELVESQVVDIEPETSLVNNGDIYGVVMVNSGSFINKGRVAHVNGEFVNEGSYCAYFNWADDGSSFSSYVNNLFYDYNEGDESASITSVVTKEPTCTEPGVRTFTGTISYYGQEYTDTKEVEIPAGHDYQVQNVVWSEDYTTATLQLVCSRDAEHTANVEVTGEDITWEDTTPATCTTAGVRTYTATATYEGVEYTGTKEVEISATGHAYQVLLDENSSPVFVWSEDYTTATLQVVCSHNAEHTANVEVTLGEGITSAVTTPATCTTAGVRTYTAKATYAGVEYTGTKEVEISATGHDYQVLLDENSNPVFVWKEDYTTATLQVVCSHNAEHTANVEVTGEGITSAVTTPATCTTAGVRTYTATATYEGDTYTGTKEVEIPATGHSFDEETDPDHTHCTACDHWWTYYTTTGEDIAGIEERVGAVAHYFNEGNGYFETEECFTSVPEGAFFEFDHETNLGLNLKSISLPFVTRVGNEAFNNCQSLESVTLPEATTIGANAFAMCKALTAISLPEAITIGDDAFSTDIALESISLPKAVTIGDYAFEGCPNLTELTLPCNFDLYRENVGLGENESVTISRVHKGESVAIEGVPATCTEDGYEAYEGCSVCLEPFGEKTVILALGHTSVTDEAVPATCTESGLTEGSHCSVCGDLLVLQEVTPALGHTPVTDEGKDATCVEPGLTAGLHCSVCDNVLVAQEEIPALDHDFKDQAIAENQGEDGYYHYGCSRCDELDSNYSFAKMFGKFREATDDEAPTETIQLTKVGNYYYASLYTDFPYVVGGDDVAYYVTSAENGVVTLDNTANVRAGSGVIFRSENSECTIVYDPEGFENTAPEDNLLTGSDEAFVPNANQYAFGLSNEGFLGFWRWPNMTIPAWKAYLELDEETSGARGFRIVFDDETNGIQQLPADASAIEGCYDLMGRKVREVKGLGIVNGKKVFVNY